MPPRAGFLWLLLEASPEKPGGYSPCLLQVRGIQGAQPQISTVEGRRFFCFKARRVKPLAWRRNKEIRNWRLVVNTAALGRQDFF